MKKNILIAAIALAGFAADAQQTLTIIEQDYELAKRTAAAQHKLLIIDCYTSWCLPCKLLDKMIFKNDSISAEISKDFVVLKYDAEQDTKHNLSLKHHICSYPTTVVLTAEGRVIGKMYGTGSGGALVENYNKLLQESISRNKQGAYLTGYTTAINADQYPDFYKKYVRRISDIKPGELARYWSDNKDLLSEVSFAVLFYFGRAPRHVADFFLQHKAEYEKRFGTADTRFVLHNMSAEKFSVAIEEKDEKKYEDAVAFAQQHLVSADAGELINAYRLNLFIALEKWEEATQIVAERIRLKKANEHEINNFCWNVYEKCQNKKTLSEAAQFMKAVVDANPSFATLDTYARLLAKNGKRQEAVTVMQRAIEMGKANGEQTKESEEALGKL
ncbi:MAG: thioredoxin family protein [Chitinophagaceae bacterium]|nr:thioredoxin family protein [Chitinophagaceae bacterium]